MRRMREAVRPDSDGPVQAALAAPAFWMVHGQSQIFFQTNLWCGIFLLAGFGVADWRMALLALLGAAASSAAAAPWARAAEMHAGMQGFCGALIGAAAFALFGGTWTAALAAAGVGALCAPVTAVVGRLFASRRLAPFALPTTTAPFCILAVMMYYLLSAFRTQPGPLNAPSGGLVRESAHALFTGVSQVVLVDNSSAGLLIVIGLFLAHWKAGAAALLGSAVGCLTALAVGFSEVNDFNGLDAYSPVLVAIAMATVFLSGRWTPWVMAIVGAVAAVLVERLLSFTGIPLYTWPYVLTTWLMLVAVRWLPMVHRAGAASAA